MTHKPRANYAAVANYAAEEALFRDLVDRDNEPGILLEIWAKLWRNVLHCRLMRAGNGRLPRSRRLRHKIDYDFTSPRKLIGM